MAALCAVSEVRQWTRAYGAWSWHWVPPRQGAWDHLRAGRVRAEFSRGRDMRVPSATWPQVTAVERPSKHIVISHFFPHFVSEPQSSLEVNFAVCARNHSSRNQGTVYKTKASALMELESEVGGWDPSLGPGESCSECGRASAAEVNFWSRRSRGIRMASSSAFPLVRY